MKQALKTIVNEYIFEVPEAVFGRPPDNSQILVFKITDQKTENLPPTSDDHHHTTIKSANTLQISLDDTLRTQMKN